MPRIKKQIPIIKIHNCTGYHISIDNKLSKCDLANTCVKKIEAPKKLQLVSNMLLDNKGICKNYKRNKK